MREVCIIVLMMLTGADLHTLEPAKHGTCQENETAVLIDQTPTAVPSAS